MELLLPIVVPAAILICVAVVQKWLSGIRWRELPSRGFEVAGVRPALPLLNDGPGTYLVVGVASGTADDVKTFISADTLANAKVKAELRGIIVTDVVKQ